MLSRSLLWEGPRFFNRFFNTEIDDMGTLEFLSAAQALLSGIVLAFIARGWRKLDTLDTEVKRLRDEKISGIENKMEHHIIDDKTQQILTEIKQLREDSTRRETDNRDWRDSMAKIINRINDKLDATREDTAKQSAEIRSNSSYIGNIDKSLQACKRNHARS